MTAQKFYRAAQIDAIITDLAGQLAAIIAHDCEYPTVMHRRIIEAARRAMAREYRIINDTWTEDQLFAMMDGKGR